MDRLPKDMIDLILSYVNIMDKINFTSIKKYYNLLNIKYAIFSTNGDFEGFYIFDLRCIFDNLNICRMYIKKSLVKNPIKHPSCKEMNENNYYTLMTERTSNNYYYKYASEGFIIEPIIINQFI